MTANQAENLYNQLDNILEGTFLLVAREVIPQKSGGSYRSPEVYYGSLEAGEVTQAGVEYSDLDLHSYDTTGQATDVLTDESGTAAFLGETVGRRTGVISEDLPDGKVFYALFVVGNRRGLFFTTSGDTLKSLGEICFALQGDITPHLESGEQYWSHVAIAFPGMIGKDRLDLLNGQMSDGGEMFFHDNQAITPQFTGQGAYVGHHTSAQGSTTVHEYVVVAGSTLVIKQDYDGDASSGNFATFTRDDQNGLMEFVMTMDLYESGAMSGVRIEGGTISVGGNPIVMPEYPITCVVFLQKDGVIPQDFTGILSFMARTLYSEDYGDYANAYVYGTITLGSSTAYLCAKEAGGNTVTAMLTADRETDDNGNFCGMIHIYGSLGDEYIDIFWPVGGRKATYVSSTAEEGTIRAVGEAFMTF